MIVHFVDELMKPSAISSYLSSRPPQIYSYLTTAHLQQRARCASFSRTKAKNSFRLHSKWSKCPSKNISSNLSKRRTSAFGSMHSGIFAQWSFKYELYIKSKNSKYGMMSIEHFTRATERLLQHQRNYGKRRDRNPVHYLINTYLVVWSAFYRVRAHRWEIFARSFNPVDSCLTAISLWRVVYTKPNRV